MKYTLLEFRETLDRVRGMDGGEFAPSSSGALYSLERICECGIQNFVSKISQAFKSDDQRDGFLIFLFVEALFQSAIHCYDSPSYGSYLELVKTPIHISWHGWTGSKPQALLNGVTRWDGSREEFLLDAIRKLVPLAAQVYDKRIAPGGGSKLIRSLSQDPDWTNSRDIDPAIARSLERARDELRKLG